VLAPEVDVFARGVDTFPFRSRDGGFLCSPPDRLTADEDARAGDVPEDFLEVARFELRPGLRLREGNGPTRHHPRGFWRGSGSTAV
jgi:hypothetical protein